MHECIQLEAIKEIKKKEDKLENAITGINLLTSKLEVYLEYQKERNEKQDKIIEQLTKAQVDNEKKIERLDSIIEGHEKLIKKNIKNIETLQDERNFNIMKFIKSFLPGLIAGGIVAYFISLQVKLMEFLKSLGGTP